MLSKLTKMRNVCRQNPATQRYLTPRQTTKGNYFLFEDNKQQGATQKEQQEREEENCLFSLPLVLM
jgi:hypothetical protein